MSTPLIAWALILIGLGLRYLIGRRRFRRRNAAGLQQFNSYGQAIWLTSIERLGMIAATIFIVAGGLLLAVDHF